MKTETRPCKQDFDYLLKSELEKAIAETVLAAEERKIAEMFLLERRPHADIAAEIYRDRSTVTRKIPGILARIAKTVERLDFRNFTRTAQTPHKVSPLARGLLV